MKTLIVKNLSKPEKLTNYIKNIYPSIVKSMLFKALRNKDIKINGKRTNQDILIKNGDTLDIFISDEFLYNLPKKIDVIFEDDNILVVFKPQGLLTNNEENDESSLESIVKSTINDKAVLSHRLDRNTSGLVIFTKNEIAENEIFDAFKNGYINKYYLAFVANSKFKNNKDVLTQYITYDKQNEYSKILNNQISGSQKIITEYEVIKKDNLLDYAILKVKIHTGKMHQIRAVLANLSHPIIGDSKYGKNEINKKFKIYKQLLFAYNYSFSFPKAYKLSYLNKINVELNNNYIDKCIGSDIIGR